MSNNIYAIQAEAALEKRASLIAEVRTVSDDKSLSDTEKRQRVDALNVEINDAEAAARSAVDAGERESEVRTLGVNLPSGGGRARVDVPFAPGQGFGDLGQRAASSEEFGTFVRGLVTGETRANMEATPSGGGVLVPLTYAAGVLDEARNKTRVLLAGARLVPMSSNELQVARVDGTPDAGWRNESAAIASGDMLFSPITFKGRSLAVLVKASRELVHDAGNFGDVLQTALAEAFAVKLDRASLYGSGVSPEPTGVKTLAGVTKTPVEANGATITWTPLVNAATAIRTANHAPTGMILSERTQAALSTLTDSTGNYLTAPSYVADVARYATTQVPNDLEVGTSGPVTSDAFVGDFSHLWIGVRESFAFEVLRERFADTGEYGFVAHLRADVQVSRADAFQVVTGIK
jgi:HK97 family phage major capsid protein